MYNLGVKTVMVNVDVARLYCRVFETKRWVGGLCVAFNVAGFAPLKISGTILNHFSLFFSMTKRPT